MDQELRDRFIKLETAVKERQVHSDKKWEIIFQKIDNLPCQHHIRNIDENTRFRKAASKGLWTIYALITGIILKLIFWHK